MESTHLRAYRTFKKDFNNAKELPKKNKQDPQSIKASILQNMVADDYDSIKFNKMGSRKSDEELKKYIQAHIQELYEDLDY